jgi:hypothetical protein
VFSLAVNGPFSMQALVQTAWHGNHTVDVLQLLQRDQRIL